MTAILTIANQKGGVGKTTTAINLAAAIALRNKKNLLIDLDPQSNTSIAFFDLAEVQASMFDVLGEHRVEMASVIRSTKDPMLFVAPARLALAKLEQQLSGQFDAPFKLKDALAPIQKDYDYIVIDSAPLLLAADTHILLPLIDQALLVVRADHTPIACSQDALKILGEKAVGCILNDVKRLKYESYYHGYYGNDKQ